MSARREYLLVDGHSVIFAWPELRARHVGPRRAAAREELVRLLTSYQDQSGVRVVVVFDGRGPGRRASDASEPGGVQVFYAPAGRSADEVLERLVAKYAEAHRLVVATADRLVEQTALTFGAEGGLSPEGLREVIARAERDGERTLREHRQRTAHDHGGTAALWGDAGFRLSGKSRDSH